MVPCRLVVENEWSVWCGLFFKSYSLFPGEEGAVPFVQYVAVFVANGDKGDTLAHVVAVVPHEFSYIGMGDMDAGEACAVFFEIGGNPLAALFAGGEDDLYYGAFLHFVLVGFYNLRHQGTAGTAPAGRHQVNIVVCVQVGLFVCSPGDILQSFRQGCQLGLRCRRGSLRRFCRSGCRDLSCGGRGGVGGSGRFFIEHRAEENDCADGAYGCNDKSCGFHCGKG